MMAHQMLGAPFSRPGDQGCQDRDRMDTRQDSGKKWREREGRAGRGEEWTGLEGEAVLQNPLSPGWGS